MPVTIIFKRGKHRSGPEHVVEELQAGKRTHQTVRDEMDKALLGVKGDAERVAVIEAHNAKRRALRGEATQKLDDYDW
jgi:hypothetical protein